MVPSRGAWPIGQVLTVVASSSATSSSAWGPVVHVAQVGQRDVVVPWRFQAVGRQVIGQRLRLAPWRAFRIQQQGTMMPVCPVVGARSMLLPPSASAGRCPGGVASVAGGRPSWAASNPASWLSAASARVGRLQRSGPHVRPWPWPSHRRNRPFVRYRSYRRVCGLGVLLGGGGLVGGGVIALGGGNCSAAGCSSSSGLPPGWPAWATGRRFAITRAG